MSTDLYKRGSPTRIAAAINVSPESFFEGSVAKGEMQLETAVRKAEAEGASLIDIGAMSTAPYKETRISAKEEMRRMTAAVASTHGVAQLPISADTQRANVAHAALEAGAALINDVSALRNDPEMARVIAGYHAGVILMANDDPELDERGRQPHEIVLDLLEQALERADQGGINREKIILDPGFGFFRHRSAAWYEFDMDLLKNLDKFRALGFPLMLGVSRKSFFRKVLGRAKAEDRLAGSLAVAVHAAQANVEWLRVHDVAETCDILKMTELLRD